MIGSVPLWFFGAWMRVNNLTPSRIGTIASVRINGESSSGAACPNAMPEPRHRTMIEAHFDARNSIWYGRMVCPVQMLTTSSVGLERIAWPFLGDSTESMRVAGSYRFACCDSPLDGRFNHLNNHAAGRGSFPNLRVQCQ